MESHTNKEGSEGKGRLLHGMKEISNFYGLSRPQANRLAAKGLLPGVFKMGRGFFLDPQAAEKGIAELARNAAIREAA